MNLIEILQSIKSKLKGFLPDLKMQDLWDMLQKYNIEPQTLFKFLIENNVGIEEIVPFFDVMGLKLIDIIELFVDLGIYYNEHMFIKELEKKYGKQEIIDAYRNSSLDVNEVNRILMDYYDVDGLPKEMKESMVVRKESKGIRDYIYAYIGQAHRVADQTEKILMDALKGIENREDKNIRHLASDFSTDNTEMIIDYLDGLRK